MAEVPAIHEGDWVGLNRPIRKLASLVSRQTESAVDSAITSTAVVLSDATSETQSAVDSLEDVVSDAVSVLDSRVDSVALALAPKLDYGCADGVNETVACGTMGQWYQVTFDTAGPVNNVEADIANNELEVTNAGTWLVIVTACFHTNPSNDYELMVKKTDGTVDLAPHLFQTTAVANKVENTSGGCFISLSANDRVELWVRCTSAATQNAIFDHVSLTITRVA